MRVDIFDQNHDAKEEKVANTTELLVWAIAGAFCVGLVLGFFIGLAV